MPIVAHAIRLSFFRPEFALEPNPGARHVKRFVTTSLSKLMTVGIGALAISASPALSQEFPTNAQS